jgi:hypothetical protein
VDEAQIREIVDGVLSDLGMQAREYTIETAMASPNSGTIQIRLLDDDGDGPAVVVDLSGDGSTDEMKRRVRMQLETFARIDP